MLVLAQVWYKKGKISKTRLGEDLKLKGIQYDSCTDMGEYYVFSIEPMFADDSVILPLENSFVVFRDEGFDDSKKDKGKAEIDLKKVIFGDDESKSFSF